MIGQRQTGRGLTHHADLGLLAGAGGADELLQLGAELLVLAQHLVELLHEVLRLALVRKVLCEERHISSGPSEMLFPLPPFLPPSPNALHTYWRWSSASPTWQCCWLLTATGKKTGLVTDMLNTTRLFTTHETHVLMRDLSLS